MNKKKLVSTLIVSAVVGGLALASTTAMAGAMPKLSSDNTVAPAAAKKTSEKIQRQLDIYNEVQPFVTLINKNISVDTESARFVNQNMIQCVAGILFEAGYPKSVNDLLSKSYYSLKQNNVNKAKEFFSEALNELNKINTENLKLQAVTQ